MATKKIQIRPRMDGNYPDVLHPETDSDMVLHGTQTLNDKLASVDGAIETLQTSKLDIGASVASAGKLSATRTLDGVDFDGSSNNTHYSTSASGVMEQNKLTTLTGFNLVAGARISVKFNNGNIHSTPYLKVNDLAAKPILKANGKALDTWQAGAVYTFIYDGSNFIVQGEGGEYGNATASDVLAGKTIGTENGLVTGTLIPRQMATGTWTNAYTDNFYYADGTKNSNQSRYVRVTGLAFRPRTVIMKGGKNSTGANTCVTVYTQEIGGTGSPADRNEVSTALVNTSQLGSTTTRNFDASISPATITDTGFSLPILDSFLTGNIEWVAFS